VLEKVSGATTPAALHVRVLVSQLSLSPAICASVAQLQFALFGMCALADSPWTFVSSRQKDTFVSSCFSARCSSGCVPAQYSLTPVQDPLVISSLSHGLANFTPLWSFWHEAGVYAQAHPCPW